MRAADHVGLTHASCFIDDKFDESLTFGFRQTQRGGINRARDFQRTWLPVFVFAHRTCQRKPLYVTIVVGNGDHKSERFGESPAAFGELEYFNGGGFVSCC